jgi:hypothetical protein
VKELLEDTTVAFWMSTTGPAAPHVGRTVRSHGRRHGGARAGEAGRRGDVDAVRLAEVVKRIGRVEVK